MRRIETIEALEARYGTPSEGAVAKEAGQITPLYRQWIEASKFCVLSTVGPGGVHGTPRGDDGPVVRIENPGRLLMPDWRGNNRLDGLRDIVEDGRSALLFLVPGAKTAVRVNAQAWVTDDPDACASFERKGMPPATVIVFDVTSVYIQCAKAILRSRLWESDRAEGLPRIGDIIAEVSEGNFGGENYPADDEDLEKQKMW